MIKSSKTSLPRASGPSAGPSATVPTPLPPGAQRTGGAGRKRWILLAVLVVVVIGGGITGVMYWLDARKFEHTDDAFIDGTLAPASAQIAGRVRAVRIRDNQEVKAGEVIAEIEGTDFSTKVTQAEAMLAAARARREVAAANVELMKVSTAAMTAQAEAGVTTAQSGVEEATAGIAQAEATVRWAQAQVQSAVADVEAAQAEATRREADVKRYDALDARAVSQQQRDTAKSASDAAAASLAATQKHKIGADAQVAQEEAKLAEARVKVNEAKSRVAQAQGVLQTARTAPQQIASSEAQVKTSEAAVAEAEAAVTAAKQQLSYTTIIAPIAGRVTRKSVQVGQYVEAGQMLCMVVSPEVWVTANFKETQLTHMHTGQVVEITVDAYPGRKFSGKVESIQAGTGSRFSLMPAENATGNFVKVVQRVPVKIVFDDISSAKALLAPGMSATPRVRIAGDEGAPGAIGQGGNGFPVASDDKVTR